MARDSDLSEEFARELQKTLRDDPDLADEFFATDEYPTDDIPALRAWVIAQIDEVIPESKVVAKFLRQHLKASEIVACLSNWN